MKWTKLIILLLALASIQGTCRVGTRDVSIEPEAKTVKINLIENRARYVNPQLAPKLTDKLRQKIVNQTRLTQTNGEADYEISAVITDYSVSTSGISNQQTSSNNLNVTVHVLYVNKVKPSRNFEADVTRNYPFAASLSLQQAETQLAEQLINNLADEIFNRIFSDW
jgi:hypothetical protein